MRGEAEDIIGERRGKAEPVSEQSERASGRGLSDTWLADWREVSCVSALPYINLRDQV